MPKPEAVNKKVFLAALLSLSCWLGLYVHRRQAQGLQEEKLREYAWSLRRGDESSRLSLPQSLALEGKYAEALSQLNPVRTQGDKDLQGQLWQWLLFDLDWPRQIVMHRQMEATSKRPRLLVRCLQSGKLDELDRQKIEAFTWSPGQWTELAGYKGGDWAQVSDMKVVHLERKDERQSQLWISGRNREGQFRLEVLYGLEQWKQWVRQTDKPAQLDKDRVTVGESTFTLVDDEWIEVR